MTKSKRVKTIALLLLLGLAYAILTRYTSFCIPCFFREITGLKCPGCGITHLCLSLMEFDIYSAYRANRFLFVTAPVLMLILILNCFCGRETREKPSIRWMTFLYAAGLILWAIIRNIVGL